MSFRVRDICLYCPFRMAVCTALWWAMCTLTTVGYGDVYPITAVGKFFASVISLVGIGIIAIPTGIIAAGFSQVIGREKRIREGKGLREEDRIENMDTEELLGLQARIVKRLSDEGFYDRTE